MTWEVGRPGKVIVHFIRDGTQKEYPFDEGTPLKNAIEEVAKREGLTAVNVTADGEEIGPSRGNELIEKFDEPIEVTPKAQGA